MREPLLSLADDVPLVESLRFAVPLYMQQLLDMPRPRQETAGRRWMKDAASRVGEAGDLLMFRYTKRFMERGQDLRVANVFEHLAKGLAAGAVLYGEARFPGLVFTHARPVAVAATPPNRRPTEDVCLPGVSS